MLAKAIDLIKYGTALGFAICVGVVFFMVVMGLVILGVIQAIKWTSDRDYKKNKEKKI
jgi:hypothetical protein